MEENKKINKINKPSQRVKCSLNFLSHTDTGDPQVGGQAPHDKGTYLLSENLNLNFTILSVSKTAGG